MKSYLFFLILIKQKKSNHYLLSKLFALLIFSLCYFLYKIMLYGNFVLYLPILLD
jgi:hypothetical protein